MNSYFRCNISISERPTADVFTKWACNHVNVPLDTLLEARQNPSHLSKSSADVQSEMKGWVWACAAEVRLRSGHLKKIKISSVYLIISFVITAGHISCCFSHRLFLHLEIFWTMNLNENENSIRPSGKYVIDIVDFGTVKSTQRL